MASRLEQLVDDYHLDPTLAGVPYAFGRLKLKENSDYPRIIWVPDTALISTSPNNAGKPLPLPATARVRQVYTLVQPCTAYLWAEDYEAAEELLHAFLAVAWRRNVTSCHPGAIAWQTQQAAFADYAARGELVAVQITFHIPVMESTDELTTIERQDHTAVLVT